MPNNSKFTGSLALQIPSSSAISNFGGPLLTPKTNGGNILSLKLEKEDSAGSSARKHLMRKMSNARGFGDNGSGGGGHITFDMTFQPLGSSSRNYDDDFLDDDDEQYEL